MAKRFTVEMIMNLAKAIGANPNKFMGTKTNINFLGKGPTKNPLFQEPLAGIETATEAQLGSRKTIIEAVEDAMGYFSSGKLNSIQSEILGHNLSGIKNIYNPPVLPMASVTDIAPGIEGLKRFPKETHKFFGRPLKDKDFTEIDKLMKEGYTDTRGRRWDFPKAQGTGPEAFNRALDAKTGMSRAIARQILQQDTRLKLKPEELFMLKEGKGEPLDLMRKYCGKSMLNLDAWLDDFLPRTTLPPRDLASRVLNEVELIPQFAEGGLAEILQAPRRGRVTHPGGYAGSKRQAFIDLARRGGSRQDFIDLALSFNSTPFEGITIHDMLMSGALPSELKHGGLAEILQVPRSGYSKGRLVKGALAILNKNKKNADYMFKASDNVSPGYAAGDLKYNAELLADQLADDAGVVFADLDAISQTKFYGTAYDYLAKEMGQYRQMTKMLKDVEQKMQLSDFSVKGRKPSASGGLAGILEV